MPFPRRIFVDSNLRHNDSPWQNPENVGAK